MHMTARVKYLSISTILASNARGAADAHMCMCACMENLNLRDTF